MCDCIAKQLKEVVPTWDKITVADYSVFEICMVCFVVSRVANERHLSPHGVINEYDNMYHSDGWQVFKKLCDRGLTDVMNVTPRDLPPNETSIIDHYRIARYLHVCEKLVKDQLNFDLFVFDIADKKREESIQKNQSTCRSYNNSESKIMKDCYKSCLTLSMNIKGTGNGTISADTSTTYANIINEMICDKIVSIDPRVLGTNPPIYHILAHGYIAHNNETVNKINAM